MNIKFLLKNMAILLIVSSLTSCGWFSNDKDKEDKESDETPAPSGIPGINPNTSNSKSALGANIEPFNAWTPTLVFTDIFPKSRPFMSNKCDTDALDDGPDLNLDQDGWVKSLDTNQCADTFVLSQSAAHYPTGTYTLIWEGEGKMLLGWDVSPEQLIETAPSKTSEGFNKATFTITERSPLGINIKIMETNPTNYIKNIRLLPPGGVCGTSKSQLDYYRFCESSTGGTGTCESGQSCYSFEEVYWDRFSQDSESMNITGAVFHPEWLREFQQYRAIRFMKWIRPEYATRSTWSERPGVKDQSFTTDEAGIPYDYQIAMANTLGSDMWVNVVMAADDNYVRDLANLLKNNLDLNLKIYIEYGNEPFDSLHNNYKYYLDKANEANSGIPPGDEDLAKVAKWHARRSVEVFEIFNGVFTGQEDRLIRTLSAFTAVPTYIQDALGFIDTTKIDAIAPAGYFGPDRRFADNTSFDAMSVDDIFQEISEGDILNSEATLSDLASRYEAHKAIADDNNLNLVAYEGGHYMVTEGAPDSFVTNNFAANRDERMGQAFYDNLVNWKNSGGQTFFHFLVFDLWNEDGAFGSFEYQGQAIEDSQRASYIKKFVEDYPCWWDECE